MICSPIGSSWPVFTYFCARLPWLFHRVLFMFPLIVSSTASRHVDSGVFAMAKAVSRSKDRGQGDSEILGFRPRKEIATAVKVEAATRHLKLNALLIETWELYREKKRAG